MKIYRLLFPFFLIAATASFADDSHSENTCEGAFESDENHLVVISKFDPGNGHFRLFFMDFQSGYARILNDSDGQLVAGPSLFAASPVELHVTCNLGGIQWQIFDKKFTARRVAIEKQSVELKSGEIRLAGTLYLPPTQPPFPAMVLLHGSGKLTRYSFGPIPYYFAANGIAVLTYDKRGTGESEGNFDVAAFPDFIADGVAAFSYLSSRKDMNPSRIGLWGSSQGGFVAAGIASRMNGVRLLINQSGMFVPAWKQEIYRVRSEMEANGYLPGEIKQAIDYLNAFFQTGKTGKEKDWQEMQGLMQELKSKAWFDLLPKVDSQQDLEFFWKTDYSYDPTSELRDVKCAVRAVFGSLDKSTPINDTVKNMKEALKGVDFEYVIIDGANHALLQAVTGSESEVPNLKGFVPMAFQIQKMWIQQLLVRPSTQ